MRDNSDQGNWLVYLSGIIIGGLGACVHSFVGLLLFIPGLLVGNYLRDKIYGKYKGNTKMDNLPKL